jgi:hypothetical protein
MIRFLFILLFLTGILSCSHQLQQIRNSEDLTTGTKETMEYMSEHGVFVYTRQTGFVKYCLSFGFEAPSYTTHKTITHYDSIGRVVEKIEYGFPSGPRKPFDLLGTVNRYPLTEEDKQALGKIVELEKNDSFHTAQHRASYYWHPDTLDYFFKLQHTKYDYTSEYILYRDTSFKYDIQVEEHRGKQVFVNNIGYYLEPVITYNMVLSERRSKKVIKKESKIIKEGNQSIISANYAPQN